MNSFLALIKPGEPAYFYLSVPHGKSPTKPARRQVRYVNTTNMLRVELPDRPYDNIPKVYPVSMILQSDVPGSFNQAGVAINIFHIIDEIGIYN